VAAAAHQATGAMGMTREFALGALTRRLWSWRDEWGGGRPFATELGRSLAAGGAEEFWPTLARGLVSPG
jgi:acyl-CoA dehydrogenase